VPLLTVAAYSYFMVIKATRHELSWKIRLTAEEIAKDLGDHFEKTFNVIDALAQNPLVIKMDTAACDTLFTKLLPSYPLHLNILTANPGGFNVGSGVDPQNAHKLNYNDKDWFQRSINGERVIADLHLSKLFKVPAIMLAAPVYDDNRSIKGVLGFPLNLEKLKGKLLKDWQLPPQSIIHIIDSKGNVLIDTLHKEHVGENRSDMPVIQAARNMANGFLEKTPSDGIKRLYYVTTPPNTDWRIFVGVPSASFIAIAADINNPYLIVIIVTALTGMVLAILIGRQLSSNVARIAEGLESIREGKLNHREGELYHRLELTGRDELSDIAECFNEMAEKHQQYEQEIKEINSQLELRVDERTAQLVAANKELDSFSYSVSHDLKSPLRSISGFSNILLESYRDKLDIEGKDCIERIHRASERMGNLIDELIEFSHINRAELHLQTVNLSDMALQIAEELRQSQPERQVEFKIRSGIMADADLVLIRSVIENLIGNAWKFTQRKEQSIITFDTKDENGATTFFIKDNGAGFNQEYADKLFSPFQRLHSSSEFEGTGIGLASVQRIIHRHGGKIWGEGREGEGATFYFTLPKPETA